MAQQDTQQLNTFLAIAERFRVSPRFLLEMALARYEIRLARLQALNEVGQERPQLPVQGIDLDALDKGDAPVDTPYGIPIARYHYQRLSKSAEYFYFADADKRIKYKKSLNEVESVDDRVAGYILTAMTNFIEQLRTQERGA